MGAAEVETAKPASKHKVKRPPRYAVVLHNDNYTTMEFVVEVLTQIFRKSEPEAVQLTLEIHTRGHGIGGIYGLEIAETKAAQVMERARGRGFPLRCTTESLGAPTED
jgi:ATP-dependent Clp protease adaptor protein ClpS